MQKVQLMITMILGLPGEGMTMKQLSIEGIKRPRGRPVTGKAQSAAERVRASRERRGLVAVTIDLPADLVDQLNEYLQFKGVTKNEVFAKLIQSQLLRKR
jgi:hypothetical protein